MIDNRHIAAMQQAGLGQQSMAIGEFGGASAMPAESAAMLSTPMYWFYEMGQAALNPARVWADATRLMFRNPANPLSFPPFGKTVSAADEMFERSTSR